jgi:catechol 2,3-dioxygenase-like lactoylglutathione lyase family enzyme
MVFHAPQPGQRPCHFGSACPHSEQTKEERARAISVSVGSEQDEFAPYALRVLTGAHVIVFSPEAEAARAFFAETLGLRSVDAGGGWPIFALPPAELAVHPAEVGGRAELYLMTDDLAATVAALQAEGIEVARPVSDQGWGLLTAIALPGGVELGLYQPRHPTATQPP